MIKINLLPVREERRRLGARQEQLLFVLIVFLVIIGTYYWWASTRKEIKGLRAEIRQVEQEITRLSQVVKDVEKFKADKKILEEKIAVIGTLKTNRLAQVHYMDELNKALLDPEEREGGLQVWLLNYQQTGTDLSLRGRALSTEHIADFMRNLEASPYFKNVRLNQTNQINQGIGDRTIKINDFGLRFSVDPGAAEMKN
jgi:type IV pilus assembly protein PilN